MRRYFCAERLKNRHSSTGKLMGLMPVLTVLLAGWLGREYFIINSYNWWYMILFPGMLALMGAAVGNRDKKMDNRAIRVLPVEMGAVWDGKILYGVRCMGIALTVFLCMTLAVRMGLEQSMGQVFLINPSAGEQIFAVVVLFVTSLWQVPFCLFVQQLAGTFPMILIHMGSYILLSAELSLHSFFMALPGGITSRLMCIILKILPNGLTAEPGSMTFTPELLDTNGLLMGIAASVIWFLIVWQISRRWFVGRMEV
ncbi:MAG: lantibiotic immunity ABC transporter MutE/EpiE family permease subunit [Lachnospiraceae bacterium]